MKRKLVFVTLAVILVALIPVLILTFSAYADNQEDYLIMKNSGAENAAGDNLRSSKKSGAVPIYSGDSQELKYRKEQYNKIALECQKLDDNLLKGQISNVEYIKKGEQLQTKLSDAGITPADYETPEEKYEEDYKINNSEICNILLEYQREPFRDLPDAKEMYDLNMKRKQYLYDVHKNYKDGIIALEDAQKSLEEVYTLYT